MALALKEFTVQWARQTQTQLIVQGKCKSRDSNKGYGNTERTELQTLPED